MTQKPTMPEFIKKNSERLLNRIERFKKSLEADNWETWDRKTQRNLTRKELLEELNISMPTNHIRIQRLDLMREEILSRPEQIKKPLDFLMDEFQDFIDETENYQDILINFDAYTKEIEQTNSILLAESQNLKKQNTEMLEIIKKIENPPDFVITFLQLLNKPVEISEPIAEPVTAEIVSESDVPKRKTRVPKPPVV